MARKIYDIKPPKIVREVEKGLKEFLGEEKKTRPRKQEKSPARTSKARPVAAKEKRSLWFPVSAVIFVLVIIVGAYLFFTLPKADISMWPSVTTLSFKQVVTADKTATGIDSTKFVIPAQYFEASKTESQDFPATGNADNTGLASGTITVFNKSGITSLKAGTHFMSDSGKLFVATNKIVLPLPKNSGSKVTPGTVTVTVQAVEGGDSYNIAPANFSVPGLKGTADYYNIYATSSVAMAGGYAGKVKKVTDDDIQGANDILVKKATDEAIADLKGQVSSDYILLDGAISSSTVTASTPTKSGSVADKFTYQASVKASAIAFKKSDLDNLAKNYISSQVPQGDTLLDNSYQISYSAGAVDISGGKEMLNVNFSSGAYQNIDTNVAEISFMGKNASQINSVANSSFGGQISKVEINFWPFWVTSAPDNQNAVKVELKFN